MKNNLTKQIKALQETDYSAYKNYYNDMYHYDSKDNEEKIKKSEYEKKKALAAAISNYKVVVLKSIANTFKRKASDLNDILSDSASTPAEIKAAKDNAKDLIDDVNNTLDRRNHFFKSSNFDDWQLAKDEGGVIVTRISNLNDIEDLGIANLTEDINLTEAEDNLIFGNFLTKNFERTKLEEASKISVGNVNQAFRNAGNNNLPPEMKNQAKMFAKKTAGDKIKQDHEDLLKNQTTSDKHLDDGKGISEADTSAIVNTIQKQIDTKEVNLQRKIDAEKTHDMQVQKQKESIKKQIDAAQTRKERLTGSSTSTKSTALSEDMKNDTHERVSPDLRSEKRIYIDKRLDPTHRADKLDVKIKAVETKSREDSTIAKYSTMLFNGASGDALKYFINGDITNGNSDEIEVAKTMGDNPEVKVVLKKINFYLRKATRNQLTYEDYIDLKVQKSQFRQLFTKAKNSYSKRYK